MILVVCKANYCRSPVAQKLLENYLPNKNISSCGIINFPKNRMDKRSIEYLKSENITDLHHTPKVVTENLIHDSKLILALDSEVLFSLMTNFEIKNEIKLLSFFSKNEIIEDPINAKSKTEYFESMMKIKKNCELWAQKIKAN